MKKPKWYAKALYIGFALALAIGLIAPVAAAGEATIWIDGPCYGKVGDNLTFCAVTVPPASTIAWMIDDVPVGGNTTCITVAFPPPPGNHVVTATGYWGSLNQTARLEVKIGEGLNPQMEYNIKGTEATFTVPSQYQGHVNCWSFVGSGELGAEGAGWMVVAGGTPRPCSGQTGGGGANFVTVRGFAQGELIISAQTEAFNTTSPPYTYYPATTLSAIKKWGEIDYTYLWGCDYETEECSDTSGSTQVWWDEDLKQWQGYATLCDAVLGTFATETVGEFHVPADGADVEWWVMDATAPVDTLPSGIPACDSFAYGDGLVTLIEDMQAAYPSRLVGFGDCDTKYIETTSGDGLSAGVTCVDLVACGEEAVKIVVVAKYPIEEHCSEWLVFPEILSWNFWTQEIEKVPQVAWAGEKIVLEKQFGASYADPAYVANFKLENQSVGVLEGIDSAFNQYNSDDSVWTHLDENGVARCILHSQLQGKADVICALYEQTFTGAPAGAESPPPVLGGDLEGNWRLINQHGFMVYFLKIESVTLGNLQGVREDHNDGLWEPIVDGGMITAATNTTMTDDTKAWDVDRWVGKTVVIWKQNHDDVSISSEQLRQIVNNTATTLTVDKKWTEVPIIGGGVDWYYLILSPVWDASLDDTAQTLNVSQDALLRLRVKGWFYDANNLSMRPQSYCDVNANGVPDMADYILPAGRWVLPDDWEYLAGPWWEENRPHWDIMDQPNDNIMSVMDPYFGMVPAVKALIEQGDYVAWNLTGVAGMLPGVDKPGALVAESPVIGPYSSLDTYTPNIENVAKLDRKTIVRNGKLNWWDCPMPPAKIEFQVMQGLGFFKDVNKGQVYYEYIDTTLDNPGPEGIAYTNPFYFTMIPANILIPAFIVGGGYDWNSWDSHYGPYPFWDIINQPPGMTPSDDQHPTKAEVYSDNHGEAMIWLNGDWNLDWATLWNKYGVVGYDIPPGAEVGNTTVTVAVDYPYFRGEHPKVLSNNITKTWTWGKEVRGADNHTYKDGSVDPFDSRMVYDVSGSGNQEKMAFIWVCDRDGFAATGEEIWWELDEATGAYIEAVTGSVDLVVPSAPGGLVTVDVVNGFLAGTNGVLDVGVKHGHSYTKGVDPLDPEMLLWQDKWDGESCHHAVAAVLLFCSEPDVANLQQVLLEGDQIGQIKRDTVIDFGVPEGVAVILGDANQDGQVNMGDVTMTERIILSLNPPTPGADANQDSFINMGDVTMTERIILGA
jgi:hypothetical protein